MRDVMSRSPDASSSSRPRPASSVQVDGNTLRVVSPAAAGPSPSGAERRRSERVPQLVDGWLSSPNDNSHATGRAVTIRDLSLHGVGILSDRPAVVGEKRWVLVNRGPMRLSTRMRVVSCRPGIEGTWEIGGEFY